MKKKLIEIQVHGFTGDGKSHVCSVIKSALIEAYGRGSNIVSRSIDDESGMSGQKVNQPDRNVIFSIEEYNHGVMGSHNIGQDDMSLFRVKASTTATKEA